MTLDEEEGRGDAEPQTVLAATDQPVSLEVREIEDDRVPEGMSCLGTFLDGSLVARCVVPPGAGEFFRQAGTFEEPRQLVLAARVAEPGVRCELYAIVPIPGGRRADGEPEEPWAASVPSSDFDRESAGEDSEDGLAAVMLGQIVRFQRDRRHPDSLPMEAADLLGTIVSGKVVEVVDKVLGELLGDGGRDEEGGR